MSRLKGQAQGLKPGAFKLWVNWIHPCTGAPPLDSSWIIPSCLGNAAASGWPAACVGACTTSPLAAFEPPPRSCLMFARLGLRLLPAAPPATAV
jgi:hypothetical protein